MRKLSIIAVTALAAVTALGLNPAAAHANIKKADFNSLTGNRVIQRIDHSQYVKSKLGRYGIMIQWKDCVITQKPELPDTNKPNKPEKPNKPNKPQQTPGNTENNKPEEDNSSLSYAKQVVKLVNKERKKAGLAALKIDKSVEKAALVRAKETVSLFSHTRPDGSKFSTALKEQGVKFRGAGENIAWGQKSPEQVMKGWMNSEGHRANILNKNYTTIGVGYYQSDSGVNYWTQLFTY